MVTVVTTIVLILLISVIVEADHDDHVQYFTPHSIHSQIFSSFAYNSSEDIFKFRYISPTKIRKGGHNFFHNVGENIGLHSKQNKVGSGTSSSLEIPTVKRGSILPNIPKLSNGEEKSKMSNDSDHVSVTFGSYSMKGKTKHLMEDYAIAETRNFDQHNVGLFAIFDGYLSHEIPKYLHSHLFENIITKSAFWVNTTRAVRKGYLLTNTRILERTKAEVVYGGLGGSAAVTAILIMNRKGDPSNYKLVVANVGDSRAVICCKNGYVAEQLSVDHVSNKMESQATKKRGVKVREAQGHGPLVNGHFPLSRAFGGVHYSHYISCEPNVVVLRIGGEIEFLVLASRPLWNVMSNQHAVDSIRKINNAQEAAKHLIQLALSMPSYHRQDDISCVVVRFN